MNRTFRYVSCIALVSLAVCCFAQQATDAPVRLLDHLAGHWMLKGTLDGKDTTHEVEAEWVLNREYLRLHEVSREKKANGDPVYEAILFVNWDAKAQEYLCLWLDNTSGAGLSTPMAHAKREDHAIPFVWVLPGSELHTTFTYDQSSDAWRWTIDDVKKGKADRFADMRLTRRR